MACKVNWQRFYTRQRTLISKLASDCKCSHCTNRLRTMDHTDHVMDINEKNRTPREERQVLIRKSELL